MSYIKLAFAALFFVFILSGCKTATPPESTDFGNLYTEHISSRIESVRNFAKDIGYMESYTSDGGMRMMVDIPAILSGALSASYDAKIRGQDTEVLFQDINASYETLLGSGGVMIKELAMITNAGDVFFRYNELQNMGLIDSSANPVLEKYKNIWLSLTQAELESSLTGASEDEVLSYKISQSIASMTLTDVENYLKKYPLWKEKANLGIVDGLQSYEVELAKENIVALLEDFSQKATEQEMTPEAKSELNASLENIRIDGKMSFDPKDNKKFIFSGILSTGSGKDLPISMRESQEGTELSVGDSTGLFTFSNTILADGNNFILSMSEEGKEVARLQGSMKKEGERLSTLSLNFTAPDQGLTVTLEHKYNADKTFEGNLNAGIGNITWKGSMGSEGLSSLQVTGAMIGSSLDMNLIASDKPGIIAGPLVVKSGDTLLASADIGLKVTREQLFLSVDVMSPEDPTLRSRALIDITGNRKSWDGNIEIPKDTKKFQDFANELSALMPQEDMFIEEDYGADNFGGNTPDSEDFMPTDEQ